MVDAMHHRGPDDRGTYFDSQLALGMTRLAILDLSGAGHQPMRNQDGTVCIVYNGELYNFKSERALLEKLGYKFESTSDTEVVLRMYEHYGDDFLKRMRGMFALAVYDRRRGPGRERLLLARDQLGIKPLLYTTSNGRFVFASEIKTLLSSGLIEPEIDPVSLRHLLTYGSICQPRTILRGVEMLLPAHRLIIENGTRRLDRYWSLGIDRRPELRHQPYESLVDELASVLEESVRLQAVADVPVGAFLSGGIDSSLLVALMARQVSGGRLKTYSVGFTSESSDLDETDVAERTARFLGTDHSKVIVQGNDVRDRLPHIVAALDQPSVDGLNSYFVSLAASEGVSVAVSGTGGDELFAGYPWFRSMLIDQVHRESQPWKTFATTVLGSVARSSVFDPMAQVGGTKKRFVRIRNSAGFVSRYATRGIFQLFDERDTARLLAPNIRKSAQAGRSPQFDLEGADELPTGSILERVTGVSLRGYTTNQLLRDIDAISMSHSLEVRVPYLDTVVADTALSLPDSAKLDVATVENAHAQTYRESGTKRILLDVGRNLLPSGYDQQVKRGFDLPMQQWLNNELSEVLQDTLSSQSVRHRGIFDEARVGVVKEKFLNGQLGWGQPWLLMIVELWCREILDRDSARSRHVA